MSNNVTISRLLAIYNAAAALLGESPMKSFKDKATAQSKIAEITEKLNKRQFVWHEPAEEQKPLREGSVGAALEALMDTDEGITFDEVVKALEERATAKGHKVPAHPAGFFIRLQRGNGRGYCRIGDRYWLVPA